MRMFENYVRIALAVLLRRKFLTLVNLFGTVLTLTVLVVAAAVLESMLHPAGAESGQERMLVVDRLCMKGIAASGCSTPGRKFFTQYIETLKTTDKTSYATTVAPAVSYVDGRKVTPQVRGTDSTYWEILSFNILAGRTIAADDVSAGRRVAVINEATAEAFFPAGSPLGKRMTLDAQTFEVIGVVTNEPATSELAYADVWVPYSTAESSNDEEQWDGDGVILISVKNARIRPAVQAELQRSLQGFVFTPDPDRYNSASAPAKTGVERTASRVLGLGDPWAEASSPSRFVGVTVLFAFLFMLLPAINMANINIGRILERSAEIGLRKATGASMRTLIGQFIFENIVLTFLGGLVAFVAAWLILRMLNGGLFTYGTLALNYRVFLTGFVLILVFGFLSGIYPAWRMARLEPAAALRGFRHV
jgi:putative ABC transport system permease protein